MLRKSALWASIAACFILAPAAAAAPAARVHSDPMPTGQKVRAKTAQLAHAPTPSETLPRTWCGSELGGDDTANALDNGPASYHGVYFVPADRPSRLAELGAVFQRDAIAASALIERTRGRAIRFDMGTRCGPEYLDISTVRLPQTTAELEDLARRPAGVYQAAAKALADVLPASYAGSRELAANYVGWLDGPAPAQVCGQAPLIGDTRRRADNLNDRGGKLALVYRENDEFCDGDVIRHEIAHTLGAAPPQAPHAAAAGHVTDAIEDTLADAGAPRSAGGDIYGEYFDYGSDDYWGELPWWTVDMSRFICQSADCNVSPSYRRPRASAPQAPAVAQPQAPAATPRPDAVAKQKPRAKARPNAKAKKRRVCQRVRAHGGKRVRRCRVVQTTRSLGRRP